MKVDRRGKYNKTTKTAIEKGFSAKTISNLQTGRQVKSTVTSPFI